MTFVGGNVEVTIGAPRLMTKLVAVRHHASKLEVTVPSSAVEHVSKQVEYRSDNSSMEPPSSISI
jgi:hypothetical protein